MHYMICVIGPDVEAAMYPFKEFGVDGEPPCEEIDETAEMRKEYEEHTYRKLKDADGVLHDAYNDKFYRTPTEAEKKIIGPLSGTGGGHGISWHSKDWGDGYGYRPKIRYVPEGFEEVEVPASEVKTFLEFVMDYTEREVVEEGFVPDTDGPHKWGYIRVDKEGNITVIDRTNPNGKWDYWTIGGRYENRMFLKKRNSRGEPVKADQGLKKDIDFEAKRKWREELADKEYTLFQELFGHTPPTRPWDEFENKDEYRAQERVVAWNKVLADNFKNPDFLLSWDDKIEEYQVPREDYIKRESDWSIMTYGYVKDGVWTERDFRKDRDDTEYRDQYLKMLDELPDDTLLTYVDIHN